MNAQKQAPHFGLTANAGQVFSFPARATIKMEASITLIKRRVNYHSQTAHAWSQFIYMASVGCSSGCRINFGSRKIVIAMPGVTEVGHVRRTLIIYEWHFLCNAHIGSPCTQAFFYTLHGCVESTFCLLACCVLLFHVYNKCAAFMYASTARI